MDLKEFAVTIFDLNVIQFGDFITKDNVYTPVYFDFRILISHPKLLKKISQTLWSIAGDVETSRVCGVPYMAIPLTTCISVETDIPMVLRRKEIKPYGTKKMIEGEFDEGDNVLIIEDVVVSGSSIMETTRDLEKEGLKVTHALVILDREQGALTNLRDEGITMKSIYTISSLLDILLEAGRITKKNVEIVQDYIQKCPVKLPSTVLRPEVNRLHLTFKERAKFASNKITKRLLELMETKKTSLCLAANLIIASDILYLADSAGPYIAVFKIHSDAVQDFSESFIETLRNIARKHDFLLMEDRKFSDDEKTVAMQCSTGFHKIADWADLISVHCIAGPGTLKGLHRILESKNCGVFLVTEMSCEGALTIGNYVKQSLTIADNFMQVVVGHMCQSNIFSDPGLIQMTRGVKSATINGADLVVVGNEIFQKAGDNLNVVGDNNSKLWSAGGKLKNFVDYRNELWSKYEERLRREA